MKENISIHWFRLDLRLSDNPALTNSAKHRHVLPIYIFDDLNSSEFKMGRASRWWLHHSLASLEASLEGNLSIYHGEPLDILNDIVARFNVKSVYWNRCYEPWRIVGDRRIKENLKAKGIEVESANGSLLWEPWTVKKQDGSFYKVFTPFYRKGCLGAEVPRDPLDPPQNVQYHKDEEFSLNLDALQLLPHIRWDKKMVQHWNIGEGGARVRFQEFINEGLPHYKDGRNVPAKPYVSRLSPHLHFGEISPNQLWYGVKSISADQNIEHFCSELGWREFSYSQLYYNPKLPRENLQSRFNAFPWFDNESLLRAWQKGRTGIPMVDAGMRELWQTGYMHNRVRMIVGSFLVKNLRLHWHYGARWFWDTLVDADLANNSAGWQWIAGCGADASPFFRIFNPATQGQKFDPDGRYIRRFVPEIAMLPDKYLFSPWKAEGYVLENANVQLDITYPSPIIDLKQSREAALAAFQSLKKRV
ncbi:MAG: Deoxyribodipyrimidine photo-lyase [Alphaproteobacteria bacterium MarineAlpha3_Bin5]|nr:deoxyribodipyrimidine photolyase [Magnetovibrio sp.]PPR77815.1 MAG: Deoxyribodipyrimidine photo-lyase [Alphaproteobacteria bacterium MarineAlpha3_Bin5]